MKSSAKLIIALVIVLAISVIMLLTFIFFLGGNKQPYNIIDDKQGNNVLSNNILLSQTNLNSVRTNPEKDYFKISTPSYIAGMNYSSIGSSYVNVLNSASNLVSCLPVVTFSQGDRNYSLGRLDWDVEMNGPYHAQTAVKGNYFTEGVEKEFSQSTVFTFLDKSDIDNWSSIKKSCSASLDDNSIKITVNGKDSYFGNGHLSVNIPDKNQSDTRLMCIRARGNGIKKITANYSMDYNGLRLQGSSEKSVEMDDNWTTLYIKLDDSSFAGRLCSLYFTLDAEEGATLFIDSISIGVVSDKYSEVSSNILYTFYPRNIFISNEVDFGNISNIDSVSAHLDLSTKGLTSIEYYNENGSNFSPEVNFTTDSLDALNLYYKSGDVISVIPDFEIDVRQIEFETVDDILRIRFVFDEEKINSRNHDVFSVIFRISIDNVEDVKDISGLLLEENVPLDGNDIKVKNGEFLGYDKKTGSYLLDMKDNDMTDITIMSEENRYIYLNILSEKGQISLYENGKRVDNVLLLSDTENIFGIYLPAGETVTFSVKQTDYEKEKYQYFGNIKYTNQKWEDVNLVFKNIEYVTQTEEKTVIKYICKMSDDTTEVTLTVTTETENGEISVSCDLDMFFTSEIVMRDMPRQFNLFAFPNGEEVKSIFYLDVSNELTGWENKSGALARLSNSLPLVAYLRDDNISSIIYFKDISILYGSGKTVLNTYLTESKMVSMNMGVDQTDQDVMSFSLGDRIRMKLIKKDKNIESLQSYISELVGVNH